MKYEVFIETHQEGLKSLVSRPETMQVVYPMCMRGIMQYIKAEHMGISLFRAGFDGIELATDPHKVYSPYLEYGVYSDQDKYLARKQAYIDYITENAVESATTATAFAMSYRLTNNDKIWFYANDLERVLVWCIGLADAVLYSESEFIALIEGTFENETILDPVADSPMIQSRQLPPRPTPNNVDCGKLRFDGLYANHKRSHSMYLRFFPTGQVVGTCSAGSADDVIKWLDTEFDASGAYCIRDGQIAFTIEQEDYSIGEVFWGEFQDNGILLNWKDTKTSRKVHTDVFLFEEISSYAIR